MHVSYNKSCCFEDKLMRKCPHGDLIYQNGSWETQSNQSDKSISHTGIS